MMPQSLSEETPFFSEQYFRPTPACRSSDMGLQESTASQPCLHEDPSARFSKAANNKAEMIHTSRVSEDQGSQCSMNTMSSSSTYAAAAPLQNEAALDRKSSSLSNDDFAAVCLDPGHVKERGYITGKQLRALRTSLKRLHHPMPAAEDDDMDAQEI